MAKSQRKIGMVLSYVSTLLLMAVNIFLTPFLIKSLGEAEYGVYRMMATFAGYLVLMNFGTGTVMTRYVSAFLGKGDKKGERNFIAMGLIITGVLMLLIAAAASVLYIFLDEIYSASLTLQQLEKAKILFAVLSLNILVTLAAQAFEGIVLAYEKFFLTKGFTIAKTLLKVAVIVTLFQLRADSLIIVLTDLGLSVLYFLLCFFYTQLHLKARPKLQKFDKALFVSTLSFSFAILLQAVVNQVNSNVDITILGIMLGPESVTVYSVAMQIFMIFSSLSTAAVAVYLPKFAKLTAKGQASGEVLTREMIAPSRVQTLVSGTILFGFIICGRDFINLWVGEGFETAYFIALIIMIPMFLVCTNGIVVSVLDALGKRLVRSVVLCIIAVCNVLLTVLLVYFIGEPGAPIATAVTTLIGSVIIMNIYYKKAIGIRLYTLFKGIFKGILPCLLLSFAVSLPLAILFPVGTLGLFLKGGLFLLVLGVSLLLFGLNKEEKSLIKKPFSGGNK
ncbi:MAG: oligosaccharide flippase family protein [Eubacteriales bacterium]|nr:oligosaccharide flippase family protein [Eubacteriales bacterium]